MSWITDAKIGTRVKAGFLTIFLLLITLSVIGITQVSAINNNLTSINDVNSVKQRYAINFRGSVHDRAIALRDVLLVKDPTDLEVTLSDIKKLEGDYIKSAKSMDNIFATRTDISNEEQKILASIKEIEATTLPYTSEIIRLQNASELDAAHTLLLNKARPAFTEWLNRINQFIDYQEASNQMISTDTREIASGFQTLMIGLTVIALLISSAFILWIMRAISPLAPLTEKIMRLADGDLNVDIQQGQSRDEVGLITSAVAIFRNNAQEIETLQTQAAENEERVKTERLKEMSKLADKFEASVTEVVDAVAQSASDMQSAARDVTSTADDTSQSASQVTETATHANQNAKAVAGAADELSNSIRDIAQQTDQSLSAAREAVKRTEVASQDMEQLTKAAASIEKVVSLINDIAEQTNLLALNATIEAARAGEAVKGFAVVANEVKSLANQTTNAIQEISAQVENMQQATTTTVSAMSNIENAIRDIENTAISIASAVEQQEQSTQNIARNIDEVSSGTSNVSTTIQQVSKGAEKTDSTANIVLQSSNNLGEQAGILRQQVDGFLHSIRTGST